MVDVTERRSDEVEVQPRASALVESMRDIGYTFEAALADLVDNSITAKASQIRILFSAAGGKPHLAIVDDGIGMSGDELTEAMRPGTRSPLERRDANDLGRFGLGLKTASFSQCRCLSVVSRKSGNLSGRQWSLDRVAESGSWYLKTMSHSEMRELPEFDALGDHGTAVIWQQMDRIIEHHEGASLDDGLNLVVAQAQKHLELVFHRFLSGEADRKVRITINGHELAPFDPFGRRHKATQILPSEKIKVGDAEVHIQPYTLPHHSKVSVKEYEQLGGDDGYSRTQGFYVYRNQRLIIHGTWFRLVRQSELTKLARVQVDIPNTLDHLWTIDVKKSRAAPPEVVRKGLRQVIDHITGRSERVYTHRGTKIATDKFVHVWDRVEKHGHFRYQINREHPLVQGLIAEMDESQVDQLVDLIRLFETSFPMERLYIDLASTRPSAAEFDEDWKEVFKRLAATFIDALRMQDVPSQEIASRLLGAEPFCRNREETQRLLKEFGVTP